MQGQGSRELGIAPGFDERRYLVLTREIICGHQETVVTCADCNSLLPRSFWERLSFQRFMVELGAYRVTELTSCLAKGYFERTVPTRESVESAWAKLRGTLLHYAVRSLGWSELQARMSFENDGRSVTILGHADAYDPETSTIYELKTTRFAEWQAENGYIPHENHVAQIQCYQTMLEQHGIPVKRLVMVYVDDCTIHTKQGPLGDRRGWMIQRASVLHKALLTQQSPGAEVGYWCRYCSFFTMCPRKQEASLYRKDRK